jgi:Asp/Glu/hydantoin racemase
MRPRIALIHAVPAAMPPVAEAFRARWPEAEAVNLLDDALAPDREAAGSLTPAIASRIGALADYALGLGAGGVLYTCSAFGPAIEAVRRRARVPVLKPNEAMFEAALEAGTRLGMLATFEPSVASMEDEFRALAAERGVAATIETICVPEAIRALKAGDAATHDRLLAAAAPRLAHCDAILLAHFSTSRAAPAVGAAVARPLFTAPGAAVDKLKRLLGAPTV